MIELNNGGYPVKNASYWRRKAIRYEHAIADISKRLTTCEKERKKEDAIDSLVSQIKVLRPVYEAAKMYKSLYDEASTPYAKLDSVRNNLFREVLIAARELEDSDE